MYDRNNLDRLHLPAVDDQVGKDTPETVISRHQLVAIVARSGLICEQLKSVLERIEHSARRVRALCFDVRNNLKQAATGIGRESIGIHDDFPCRRFTIASACSRTSFGSTNSPRSACSAPRRISFRTRSSAASRSCSRCSSSRSPSRITSLDVAYRPDSTRLRTN